MTNQMIFNFDDTPSLTSKRKIRRCPLCKQMPKNRADKNTGFAFSCLCRCAMLGRFSFYEEIAIDDWNRRVLLQLKKMEHIIPRKRKRLLDI